MRSALVSFVLVVGGCASSAPPPPSPPSLAIPPLPPPAPAVEAPPPRNLEREYVVALAEIERAFNRDDPIAARRALEAARDVADEAQVASAMSGLATRFGKACDLVAKGADTVPYADAVIPLRASAWRLGAERAAVLAAFRFAERTVFRELQAELGGHRDVARGRAILRMAGIDPKNDTPMMQWVHAHVPEAGRGVP